VRDLARRIRIGGRMTERRRKPAPRQSDATTGNDMTVAALLGLPSGRQPRQSRQSDRFVADDREGRITV